MALACAGSDTIDRIYRNTSIPSLTTYTECMWFYYNGTRAFIGNITYKNNNGTDTQWMALAINTSTNTLRWEDQSSGSNGSALSTGNWYHIAVSKSGSSVTVYLNGVSDITFSHTASNTSIDTWKALGIEFSGFGVNGSIVSYKVWDGAALTQAEIQQEMNNIAPVRTSNLYSWLPCLDPTLASNIIDYSGAAHNWTIASGLSVTAISPPVPFRSDYAKVILPSAGASGVTVTPSLFTGAFSNFSPTISGGANISPSLLTSQFSNFTPIILIEATPGLITAAFSNFAPTVTGGASISPSLLTAAFGNFAPTIVTNANVSPALISAAFSAFSATVSTDTIVEPGLFTAAFNTFAPTISGAANVAPSLIAANFSNFAPTIVFDTFVTPSVFTGSFDVFAPAIQAGALIPIADLTEATFSLFNPNVNPSSNTARNSSIRVWLALSMN